MNRMNMKDKWKELIIRNRKSGGYLLKKIISRKVYQILRAVLLFGLCFLILQPLFNKISLSFMQEKDLYDPTIIVLPRNFTLGNYKLPSGEPCRRPSLPLPWQKTLLRRCLSWQEAGWPTLGKWINL